MTGPIPSAGPDQDQDQASEQQVANEQNEQRFGWLPGGAVELFGEGATAEEAYELLTVDVPVGSWTVALLAARDGLGCTFFDWLSAVDEPGTGLRICAHVVARPSSESGADRTVRRLLLRTTVPHEEPVLPTATDVYAGAAWHERETHEMFGVSFAGNSNLAPLLLPEGFEGHPLRKEFVLAARVAKAWPGAKDPGESEPGGPKRRQVLPPGVPDPNEWGPLKGKVPPAPSRPARGRAAAAGEDRPARRTRSAAADGSAGQQPGGTAERPARRMRSASQGSASQRPGPDDGRTGGGGTPGRAGEGAGSGTGGGPGSGQGPGTGQGAGPDQAAGSGQGARPGQVTGAGHGPGTGHQDSGPEAGPGTAAGPETAAGPGTAAGPEAAAGPGTDGKATETGMGRGAEEEAR